jgi:hypothetical protein
MTYTEASKELNNYKDVLLEIDNLRELIYRFENSKIKALRYDLEKSNIGKHFDISDDIAKIDNIKSLYDMRLSNSIDLLTLIETKIDSIESPLYRTILSRKYILGEKLEYIAIVIQKSQRHILRLHRNAVMRYSKA